MSYTDHNSTKDHRAVEQIIREAIKRSISHNEIVHVDEPGLGEAIALDLYESCEGDAKRATDGVHEFWGEDCDGQSWRVHVCI